MTAKKRYFFQNRTSLWKNCYICLQISRYEETNQCNCLPASLDSAARFVCFEQVASHSEGRTSDGATGKECRKTVRQGENRALQTSGEKDAKDDKKGQKARRTHASSPEIESVFLLTLEFH